METKICNTCEKEKPIDEFRTWFHKKRNKFYTKNKCRGCELKDHRQYYKDNPERFSEYGKQWREAHPDYSKRSAKKWRLDNPHKHLLKHAKYRALEKNIEFDLDEEWVKDKLNGVCERTLIPFYIGPYEKHRRHPFAPSIDRIDNNKGYTKDNCQVVVWMYNQMKNEYSDDLVYNFAKAIIHNKEFI